MTVFAHGCAGSSFQHGLSLALIEVAALIAEHTLWGMWAR